MKNVGDPNKKASQVFKVFTRQVSRFAFPPKLPRPRIDYSKLKDDKKKGDSKKKKKTNKQTKPDNTEQKNENINPQNDVLLMQDMLGYDNLRDEIDGTSSVNDVCKNEDKFKESFERFNWLKLCILMIIYELCCKTLK